MLSLVPPPLARAGESLDTPFSGSTFCAETHATPRLDLPVSMLRQRGGSCYWARRTVDRATSNARTGVVRIGGHRCRVRRRLQTGVVYRCSRRDFTVQFYYGA